MAVLCDVSTHKNSGSPITCVITGILSIGQWTRRLKTPECDNLYFHCKSPAVESMRNASISRSWSITRSSQHIFFFNWTVRCFANLSMAQELQTLNTLTKTHRTVVLRPPTMTRWWQSPWPWLKKTNVEATNQQVGSVYWFGKVYVDIFVDLSLAKFMLMIVDLRWFTVRK